MGSSAVVVEVEKVEADQGGGRLSPGCGCLTSVTLGLLGGLLVLGVLAFAIRGEIRLQRGELGETRLWRITGEDSTVLAFLNTRRIRDSESEGQLCQQTTVRFWYLGGGVGSEAQRYCDCYRLSSGSWVLESECR